MARSVSGAHFSPMRRRSCSLCRGPWIGERLRRVSLRVPRSCVRGETAVAFFGVLVGVGGLSVSGIDTVV
jgi:hypothetical protein